MSDNQGAPKCTDPSCRFAGHTHSHTHLGEIEFIMSGIAGRIPLDSWANKSQAEREVREFWIGRTKGELDEVYGYAAAANRSGNEETIHVIEYSALQNVEKNLWAQMAKEAEVRADLERQRDAALAQCERMAAFMDEWLAFEQSCIDKDGPYVNFPIPKLMDKARAVLAEYRKGESQSEADSLNSTKKD